MALPGVGRFGDGGVLIPQLPHPQPYLPASRGPSPAARRRTRKERGCGAVPKRRPCSPRGPRGQAGSVCWAPRNSWWGCKGSGVRAAPGPPRLPCTPGVPPRDGRASGSSENHHRANLSSHKLPGSLSRSGAAATRGARTGGRTRRRAPPGSVGSSCAVRSVTARLSAGPSEPVLMTKVERSASSSRTR